MSEATTTAPGATTMVRTLVDADGVRFMLAQDQDVADLKRRIEAASASTGTFVEFVILGNREVSVLVNSRTRIVLSVETVQFDPRDTGDSDSPFGGFFDLDY